MRGVAIVAAILAQVLWLGWVALIPLLLGYLFGATYKGT